MRYIKGRRPWQQAQTKIHRLHIDEKVSKRIFISLETADRQLIWLKYIAQACTIQKAVKNS